MLGITAAAISSEPTNRATLGRRRSADPDRVACAAVRARSEPFNSCAKRIAIGAPLAAGVKLKPLTRSCPNGVRVNRLLPVVSPVSDVTVEPKLTKWAAVTAVTVNWPVARGLSPVLAIGPPRAPRSTPPPQAHPSRAPQPSPPSRATVHTGRQRSRLAPGTARRFDRWAAPMFLNGLKVGSAFFQPETVNSPGLLVSVVPRVRIAARRQESYWTTPDHGESLRDRPSLPRRKLSVFRGTIGRGGVNVLPHGPPNRNGRVSVNPSARQATAATSTDADPPRRTRLLP